MNFLENMTQFKKFASNAIGFVKNNTTLILFVLLCVFAMLFVKSCKILNKQKEETARLENNVLALNDTLKNYKKDGKNIATMRALQLKVEELEDSLKLERGKTPVTIINYMANVDDTVYLPTTAKHDTVYIEKFVSDRGLITAERYDTFGKSKRHIYVSTPYAVNSSNGMLYAADSTEVVLNQDIWLESILYKDGNKHTYIMLSTDYPSITFNNGTGILVENGSDYDYSVRKNFGVGIGLHVGYGANVLNGSIRPAPYIGVGIGLQWNPKFLQF